MKKQVLTALLFSVFSIALNAQIQNVQVVSCIDDTTDIYEALGSGKVLLVASKGTDCSACMNRAGALQQWASSNTSKVQVWGAMTKIYSNVNPSCREVIDWIVYYNWTSIFTFVDENKIWRDQGTPRYYVYDPRDSSLAYNGFSTSDAQATALSIASQMLSTNQTEVLKKPRLKYTKNKWTLVNLQSENYEIEVLDLTGQTVKTISQNSENSEIEFSNEGLNKGIYLIHISNKGETVSVIKALLK